MLPRSVHGRQKGVPRVRLPRVGSSSRAPVGAAVRGPGALRCQRRVDGAGRTGPGALGRAAPGRCGAVGDVHRHRVGDRGRGGAAAVGAAAAAARARHGVERVRGRAGDGRDVVAEPGADGARGADSAAGGRGGAERRGDRAVHLGTVRAGTAGRADDRPARPDRDVGAAGAYRHRGGGAGHRVAAGRCGGRGHGALRAGDRAPRTGLPARLRGAGSGPRAEPGGRSGPARGGGRSARGARDTASVTEIRHPFLDRPPPLAFAHRGGAVEGLENTVTAFRRAVDLGYSYLETDVHATADGRLVAFHDDTLDRVTDGRGRIADLTWEQVRRVRIAGKEPVPLFSDLLETLPHARWNIDVKADAALAPLLAELETADAWDRVCVGAFDERRVARAQELAGPRLATSLGTRGVRALRLRSWGLPLPVRRGAVCVQVPVRHGRIRVVDAAFVRAAHRLGMQVHVWTVNDADTMRALLELGVDGIMTDHIELLREVLTARGAWQG
ncbi:glycerophosphodiester phosphodiesterase [Streptomyces sp. RKND-216]|nr:glycerophosphodiester phosphodiesterase [Streptomyces sp. RKND-216]